MKPLLLDAYPGGKRRAFTFTFDDGRNADRRFVQLLNDHGLKGTFHLNTCTLMAGKDVRPDEVKALYQGHEVASHSVTHPHLPHLSNTDILREVLEDRKYLESLVGYPVRGFAYPGGGFDDRVVKVLEASGLTYARTTRLLGNTEFPSSDFLRLGFSCRHTDANQALEKFLAQPARWSTQALIVMGHSYEFENPNVGWDNITALCKRASNQESLWYTTLIQLVDYTLARLQLQFSADGSIVHNPTATTLWATLENQIIQIQPGQTLKL